MATRGFSWGGTSLPITDASLTSSRDPVIEQAMSGTGGKQLYGGTYNSIQGSFTGAYRSASFKSLFTGMLVDDDSSHKAAAIIWDDNSHALECPTAYITSAELTMTVGSYAKCTFNFVGQSIESGTAGSAAAYTTEIPIFYKSSTTWGACSEFTIRIERPYTADDFILGGDQFFSQSIYQSGDAKVSGTIKLSQTAEIALGDPGSITLTLGFDGGTTETITISDAVLSNIEMSASGRGLMTKTKAWAAPADSTKVVFS